MVAPIAEPGLVTRNPRASSGFIVAHRSENLLVEILRATIVDLVRSDTPDLKARQLAIFLICYLEEEDTQTVRGLAANLRVQKPVITIALTRLSELELLRRRPEPGDRRGIVVGFTPKGRAYLQSLVQVLGEAAAKVEAESGQPRSVLPV